MPDVNNPRREPRTAPPLAAITAEVGFPTGVINVATGYGEEAQAALVRHPLVRGISFTGSVDTGRQVMAGAAEEITPVVLELGGKNPMVVFEDADLERAVTDAAEAAFDNCGQVCSSASCLLLHALIADESVTRLEARAGRLRIGPGKDDPDLGPLAFAAQRKKVAAYVDLGQRDGARAPTGGIKQSGIGRERGLPGVHNYLQTKNVAIRI